MPFYEYQCEKCGKKFEKLISISQADKKQTCPNCGGKKTKKYFLYLPPILLRSLELPVVVSREVQAVADRGRGQSKNECWRKIKGIYKSQGRVNHAYL